MASYSRFGSMAAKFIVEKGPDLLASSAKEASDNNKSFIRTLGDNAANEAISDIAEGIFGGEAIAVFKGAEAVMKGVDKVFQYGREKAQHEVASGVIASGQLGSGTYKTSQIAATMRQRQLQSMNSDIQNNSRAFGSEARRRAMNISY